jgi:HlyD family secretion protein
MKTSIRAATGLIAGSLLLAACAMPAAPGATTSNTQTAVQGSETTLQRATATKGNIEDKVVGTGAITANQTADVAFQTTGQIKEVLVKAGDQAKRGQVLATLDDTDLQLSVKSQWASYISAQAALSETMRGPSSADLSKAQAALSSAQAAYNDLFKDPSGTDLIQAQADLQTAEASLRSAQAAYDRRAARDPGVGASQEALELEQATIAFNKAKAAYDAKFAKPSNASVASAVAQIQTAKASLAALQPVSETVTQRQASVDQAYIAWQQAASNVSKATLTAPMDGLVTAVNIVAGAQASTGAAAVQIAEFANPVFVVNIDEADLGLVRVGLDANVRLQTYPDQIIPAKVTAIAPTGTSNSGITVFKVDLTIPPTDKTPTILLNMSGTGEVITAQAKDAVLIPFAAVTESKQGTAKTYSVLVEGANGQSKQVEVTLGRRSGSNVQILSGVNAGDVVLYTPAASATGTTTTTNRQQGGFGGPPIP